MLRAKTNTNSAPMFMLALLGFSLLVVASGKGLRNSATRVQRVFDPRSVNSELKEALAEAMGHGHSVNEAQLAAKLAWILPVFESLPKNLHGRVGRDGVRYLVHRYFASAHGWSVKGFEQHRPANSSENLKILEDRLPGYVEEIMERKLTQHGFAAADVVTMVAAVERMVFDEGLEMLEAAYALNGRRTDELLREAEMDQVLRSYMMIYAAQADREDPKAHEDQVQRLNESFEEGWPAWDFMQMETTTLLKTEQRRNPFAAAAGGGSEGNGTTSPQQLNFEMAARVVDVVGEGYGPWQNRECRELKETLVSLDKSGIGRVRLADFYRKQGSGGSWFFEETPEYLRQLGVLDESSLWQGPQLMIPNYVLSHSNCLEPSDFYSICCLNECEGILGAIEAEVRAPAASVEQIVSVVERLRAHRGDEDDNEELPKGVAALLAGSLSPELRKQLGDVAEHHKGKVTLHGRLFAKWLHKAFPHECPFPVKSNEMSALTVSEWQSQGNEATLSALEIEEILKEDATAQRLTAKDVTQGPQTNGTFHPVGQKMMLADLAEEEELYVGHHHEGPRRATSNPDAAGGWRSFFAGVAQLVLLGAVLATLRQYVRQPLRSFGKMGGGALLPLGASFGGKDLIV